MPQSFEPSQKKFYPPSFYDFYQPIAKILPETPVLESRGDRPLKMTFEDQLKALIFFTLKSMSRLVILFKSSTKMISLVTALLRKMVQEKAVFLKPSITGGLNNWNSYFKNLPVKHLIYCPNSIPTVAIDGSLIDAVLSMTWADYRKNSKKAKIHLGFNLNQGIPSKIFFTNAHALRAQQSMKHLQN